VNKGGHPYVPQSDDAVDATSEEKRKRWVEQKGGDDVRVLQWRPTEPPRTDVDDGDAAVRAGG
jgi:hypothetical protein